MGRRRKAGRFRLWEVWAPTSLDEAAKRAIEAGYYLSRSELVRQAVWRELERLGLLSAEEKGSGGECGDF